MSRHDPDPFLVSTSNMIRAASSRWRRASTLSYALGFTICAGVAAQDASIVRGPYLQLCTSESIVIRWRTDVPTDSRVRVGTAVGQLNSVHSSETETTEHEINVDGLTPDTLYYYAIGTATEDLAGDDVEHLFVTAPSRGVAKRTRVWVIGDSGSAERPAELVRDAYLRFSDDRLTDLWIMLGDNAYNSGTDEEYQNAVFDMYPSLLRTSSVWPTLGNHDGITADSATLTGPYYDIFTIPTEAEAGGVASGTEAYYSFDYGNIHFVSLESHETDRSTEGAMMQWLVEDLAANESEWLIAFWHHPPYSKGSHDSDREQQLIEMRRNALPILEAAGVDLVLAGHSHSYERSVLVDQHYGRSHTLSSEMLLDCGDGREEGDGVYRKAPGLTANDGAVYIVAGSSGGRFGFGPLDHPIMFLSTLAHGSVVLDFDGSRLDVRFLTDQGDVADSFTLEKDRVEPREPADCTSPGVAFRRGDANADGNVTLPDAVWILNELFRGGESTRCRRASDVNDDAAIDIADVTFLINHLFQGGEEPNAPFPNCGLDTTFDLLPCSRYPLCDEG